MDPRYEAERQSATRELEKLRHDGDALGGTFTRWFAPRAADAGDDSKDDPKNDPLELWGTRIGRGLSLTAVVAGCLYLIWVYLR
jgi:hypothetical protein